MWVCFPSLPLPPLCGLGSVIFSLHKGGSQIVTPLLSPNVLWVQGALAEPCFQQAVVNKDL